MELPDKAASGSGFDRILVARFSPKNGCRGPEGEWLVPATDHDRTDGTSVDSHLFVTVQGRHPNRFGWVAELAEPVSAGYLKALDARGLRAHMGDDSKFTMPDEAWYSEYLTRIARYQPGTPMACDWRLVRGPGVNRKELWIHLVKFY